MSALKSALNLKSQQTPTYQHGTSGYEPPLASPVAAPAAPYEVLHLNECNDHPSSEQNRRLTPAPLWFFILWQPLYRFLRPYEFTEDQSCAGEHETPTDYGSPIDAISWSLVSEQSLNHFLQRCALTEHPPSGTTGSGHETLVGSPTCPPFLISAHFLYQFLLFHVPTEDPSCSEHEAPADQHGSPIYARSWFLVPAQSLYQFLQDCVLTGDLSSGSGNLTSADQYGMPASQSALPEQPHNQDHQLDTLAEHPSFDGGHEAPAKEPDNGGVDCYVLSRSAMPTPSQNEVDAQPNEPTASIPSDCPICGRPFKRVQERDRHLEFHLPHSIYCPSPGCPWTGRRRSGLETHWEKKHSGTGQVLGKEIYQIYDPKPFVRSILDSTSQLRR
ncbi:hypothetical protein DFH94DRAFT_684399 [Russula ochroleuca]|uniref:C2H2-type domain-containing protein n=1 Tax=Russula ochroleuca TaxID=152965 RepID=A0A9P5MQD0_9AGAM|nr:hypothetical protein DFH94DRAFT_684399 [Russula ochroleuca]